ncbi:MAG: chemotaxis protein CheW [Nitrospirae bacterium]|nr:chemotaxis protein CheW [Nitrospirota bacterium]
MAEGFSTDYQKSSRGGGDRRQQRGKSAGRNERRASTADRRHANNRQYATFFLGDHFFGVGALTVQEILIPQQMTAVPLAPSVIAGLINLRGEIVTVMDLRTRLGFPPRPEGLQIMSVVVRTADGLITLLVDQIGDVIEVRPDLFEPPPKTLNDELLSVVEGVYKLQDKILLVLNSESVAQVPGSTVRIMEKVGSSTIKDKNNPDIA